MKKLLTRWGKTLNRDCPLNDYPRPQMARDSFLCLNGPWEYAICPTDAPFSGYQGEIIVPFSPETILSGVERTVTPSDTLYYRKR
ncbi:MAG: glycoside hydrolase family 2, partial [Clostridia bacterium]|nr:glycoside hydrolase family 2 [Clostridia bacterium]